MILFTPFEQYLAFTSGLIIKPIYMVLVLGILALARKPVFSGRTTLCIGLAAFWLGEAACALNFLSAGGASDWLDGMHDLGMVAMGIFVPWGLLTLFDTQVIGFIDSQKRCVLQRFCGRCYKQHDVPCGLKRLMIFAALFFAVVALLPLTATIAPYDHLGTVFGSEVRYTYSPFLIWLNFRLFPIIAAGCFVATAGLLWGAATAPARAKGPFFVGLGFWLFSWFRFCLVTAFARTPVWLDFWEELTELLITLGVGLVLWFFRAQLRPTSPAAR